MMRHFLAVRLSGTFLVIAFCAVAGAQALPPETAIDRYVKQPDDSFSWKIVKANSAGGMKSVVVDMVSQTWRTPAEVSRTQWQHWVTLAFPEKLRSTTGFLLIGGGSNRGGPPDGPSDMVQRIAQATGTVVAELGMVPNQPLVFNGDGKPRVEDDLIGFTWDQYLKTRDATWLARNPMVKSAVRAMDTMTAVMASETGGGQTVDRFVVAGGSKRGWTTWLTGAMDNRVAAIIPIVIDVVNVDVSMRHHFAAYGFWAPAVGNYVQHRIMERMGDPILNEIYRLVDPYYYRHRLTMPKFVLNAAGDQFFLPDSSQFYWGELQGPKYLRYVPNTDHGMDGSDAIESVTAFYALIVAGRQPPEFTWKELEDGAFQVMAKDKPREVRLWQATNPNARDFRVETLGRKYTSRVLENETDGVYEANVEKPRRGWSAYFVELTYDVGLPIPLKLTTNVRVVPDELPFYDKDPHQPATLTLVCTAPSEEGAARVLAGVGALAKQEQFAVDGLQTKQEGTKCYFNWRPSRDRFERQAAALTAWLNEQGCDDVQYQLESGSGITTAPVPAADEALSN